MTIQNKTARAMLYDWHSGQTSPFYAAASSGLCRSFQALAMECATVDNAEERRKLLTWIQKEQGKNKPQVCIAGAFYWPLPWGGRA